MYGIETVGSWKRPVLVSTFSASSNRITAKDPTPATCAAPLLFSICPTALPSRGQWTTMTQLPSTPTAVYHSCACRVFSGATTDVTLLCAQSDSTHGCMPRHATPGKSQCSCRMSALRTPGHFDTECRECTRNRTSPPCGFGPLRGRSLGMAKLRDGWAFLLCPSPSCIPGSASRKVFAPNSPCSPFGDTILSPLQHCVHRARARHSSPTVCRLWRRSSPTMGMQLASRRSDRRARRRLMRP